MNEQDGGVVLYTEDGDPVRVRLMDREDNWLNLTVQPERGVYVYENEETGVTMFLEKP